MSFLDMIQSRIDATNHARKRRRVNQPIPSPSPQAALNQAALNQAALNQAALKKKDGNPLLRSVCVNIPTLRMVRRTVFNIEIPTLPSLRRELADAAHLSTRSEPGGLVASVRRRDQVAILWTSTDFGLMNSIALWFRRQHLDIIEVPLQECGSVGSAVVDAHLSGKVPVYTCISKHVIPPLVDVLKTSLSRGIKGGCIIIANDPYCVDESPLRTELGTRAKVYRIPVPSERQTMRCLAHAAGRWRHASDMQHDPSSYTNSDPRKALIDYHLDQISCLGTSKEGGAAKDVVARGPIEETEAGVWENNPEGVLEYAWCSGIGACGKITQYSDEALWAAVEYADNISLAANLDPWCKEPIVGCIAGQALRSFEQHTGVRTLTTDKEQEAERKAINRKATRASVYKNNLANRREYNATRRYLQATDGRDRSDVFSCLRYESADTSRFTTPSKAFRRLLAASGVKITFRATNVVCSTPCVGRHLAEHFGIAEGVNNKTVRLACSALAATDKGPITCDAITKDISWANHNPIPVRKDETPLQAALRDS
jgi:hypothetical protein